MAKVICNLENASEKINGVKFEVLPAGGRISEEISDEQAADFASIPGYEIVGAAPEGLGGAPAAGAASPAGDDATKSPADMTVGELKEALTAAGKTFPANAKKADLIALMVAPAEPVEAGGEAGQEGAGDEAAQGSEAGAEGGAPGGDGEDETVF